MKNITKIVLAILLILAIGSCATKDSESIAKDVKEQLESTDLSNVEVSVDEKGVKIITTGLLFNAGSHEVTTEIAEQLDSLGHILQSYDGHQVLIEGHTADVGAASAIQTLSEARAQSITDYLIEKGYIKESMTSVEGRGASDPVDTNDTKEGRAKNRRVEITILN